MNVRCGSVVWAGLALGLSACTQPETPVARGQALFQDYCAVCHGDDARGGGPLAADWDRPPADLTGIAARNGGSFPLAQVMSQIDGYARRDDVSSAMPEMGPVFAASPRVMTDTGDGIVTPVPEALLDLALYIADFQE